MNMTKPFTKIPNHILFNPDLKPSEKMVYAAIRSFSDGKTAKNAFPSREKVASKLNIDPRTVDRAKRALRAAGVLNWKKGGKSTSNRYDFMEDSETPVSHQHDKSVLSTPTKMSHYQEPDTKNYLPRGALFHRSDKCWVKEDGIRIKTHTGEWMDYGGGDDEGFRYGNLIGKKALEAAIKRFRSSKS